MDNRGQNIAKKYHEWQDKNPFGKEYTISTNDFDCLLFELEQKGKEINLLRESKINVEYNRQLLLEEKQKLKEERDFYKEDRNRCERLERKAFEELEVAQQEIERWKHEHNEACKRNAEVRRTAIQREQKLINGLKNVRDRVRIAQLEEDEWGWAQALKSIQRQIGELFKEFEVIEE